MADLDKAVCEPQPWLVIVIGRGIRVCDNIENIRTITVKIVTYGYTTVIETGNTLQKSVLPIGQGFSSVSYTHLTLPTILLV